jgi:RNA polymerase sigma factor (sigma-70 family)
MGAHVADSERPDHEWVRLAQEGDRGAYGALVRRHQDRIYRHLLHLTGSREEALELAQEVFIKAWQALPEWRPDAQFHTWIYRIASNLALDVLRRRKVVQFVALEDDFDAPSDAAGPETQLQARQGMRTLDAALARLAPEQREIILLREVEGLSYGELAATLAIDEGTVKSRLARARVALAALYPRTEK